jgi:hypothetical protein
MKCRVIIDVGGFHGHASLAALDPILGFDRVFCFDPDKALAANIRRIWDPRLFVIEAALADRDGEVALQEGARCWYYKGLSGSFRKAVS